MQERSQAKIRKTLPAAQFQKIRLSEGFAGRVSSADLFQNVSAMNLMWAFAAVAPLGVASLVVFAAHIDPLSGHWRTPTRSGGEDETADA